MSDVPMGGWEKSEARSTHVDSERCVNCKLPADDWDDDVEPVSLETGETICETCLADSREWKRSLTFKLVTHHDMPEHIGEVFNEHYENMVTDLREKFGDVNDHGHVWSNAGYKRDADTGTEGEADE